MLAALGDNCYGRLCELRLRAEVRDGATVVSDQYATMPFKVMRPFVVPASELPGLTRTEDHRHRATPAQVMVMSVSAGIMAGDEQRIDVDVAPGAALQMTTQSFEKIHRMDDGACATRVTNLHVAPGAYLDYSPLPQIPFAGSAFAGETRIELDDEGARLVYGEILSAGRVARGELFAYRSYCNHVRVEVAGRPVFLDNTIYEPVAEGPSFSGACDEAMGFCVGPMDMEAFGLYEGFTHLANLVLVNIGVSEETFAAVRGYLREVTGTVGAAATPLPLPHDGVVARQASSAGDTGEGALTVSAFDDEVAGGITRLASGDCVVRLLGRRAQRLQDVLAHVRSLL